MKIKAAVLLVVCILLSTGMAQASVGWRNYLSTEDHGEYYIIGYQAYKNNEIKGVGIDLVFQKGTSESFFTDNPQKTDEAFIEICNYIFAHDELKHLIQILDAESVKDALKNGKVREYSSGNPFEGYSYKKIFFISEKDFEESVKEEWGEFRALPAFSVTSKENDLVYTIWGKTYSNDPYAGEVIIAADLTNIHNKANADDLVACLVPYGSKNGIEAMCGVSPDFLREIIQGSAPSDVKYGDGIRTIKVPLAYLKGNDTQTHDGIWRGNYSLIKTPMPEEGEYIVNLFINNPEKFSESEVDQVVMDSEKIFGDSYYGENRQSCYGKIENALGAARNLEQLRLMNLNGEYISYEDWCSHNMPLLSFDDGDTIQQKNIKICEYILETAPVDMRKSEVDKLIF